MKRLQLAYAWGKWLANRREEYENAMEFYKSQRPRRNMAILVEHDEMACLYQRCKFRIERARRAVGANGMIGFATFDDKAPNATINLMGAAFPVRAASGDDLAKMNFDNFHKWDRTRAVKAKQIAADKRHPLDHYRDVCAEQEARDYEAELASMRYY